MYSPKIAEDLVPVLYRIGKAEGRPMTHVVNEIIRKTISVEYARYIDETLDKSPLRIGDYIEQEFEDYHKK